MILQPTRPHPAFLVLWSGQVLAAGMMAYTGLANTPPFSSVAAFQNQLLGTHTVLLTGLLTWAVVAVPWFFFLMLLATLGLFGERTGAMKMFREPPKEGWLHLLSLFPLVPGSCFMIQAHSAGIPSLLYLAFGFVAAGALLAFYLWFQLIVSHRMLALAFSSLATAGVCFLLWPTLFGNAQSENDPQGVLAKQKTPQKDTKRADLPKQLVIPLALEQKHPELIKKLKENETMGFEEKQGWVDKIPTMTDEQIGNLDRVLDMERRITGAVRDALNPRPRDFAMEAKEAAALKLLAYDRIRFGGIFSSGVNGPLHYVCCLGMRFPDNHIWFLELNGPAAPTTPKMGLPAGGIQDVTPPTKPKN